MNTARRVGLVGATGIGVGSMLGAGVFSDMWAQVLAAGDWYLVAVLIAAAVALANALSTAQLAASHPVAGGVYAYGRAELSYGGGHLAGSAFMVGKTVSVAVGALVLGAYILPGHTQWVASAAIVAAWALNSRGITRTAAGATAIAAVVCAVVAVLVALAITTDPAGGATTSTAALTALETPNIGLSGAPALLVGAAAVFFAFAGYARIATLGEEVRDPARTIPRAILGALGLVVAIYLLVAFSLHRQLVPPAAPEQSGTALIDLSHAPLEQLADAVAMPVWIVTVAAALSVGGAMLAVMAGAGRTAMAMAREGDLPRALARQGASGAPWLAEAAVAALALVLVWTSGTNLILVSVAAILVYYAVAHVAAINQRRHDRTASLRVPVWVSAAGLVGCVVLAGVAAPQAAGSWWALLIILIAVIGWPALATWRHHRAGRARGNGGAA